MNDKFDEMTKGLAQSVTRRQALRRFGIGLAGIVLATVGLASKATGRSTGYTCCRYGCGSVICEPPGSHCQQAYWYYNSRHQRFLCKLISATAVQDCTACA